MVANGTEEDVLKAKQPSTTVSIHFFIATAGAIFGAIMLTAALMGLVFLSSGSGHDEAIDDPFADEADR